MRGELRIADIRYAKRPSNQTNLAHAACTLSFYISNFGPVEETKILNWEENGVIVRPVEGLNDSQFSACNVFKIDQSTLIPPIHLG